MSRPNANGILECNGCGSSVHIRHTVDGQCPECCEADANNAEALRQAEATRFLDFMYGIDFMPAIPGADFTTEEVAQGVHKLIRRA